MSSTTTPRTVAATLREAYLGKGVVQIVDQPYPGHFDYLGQLQIKERLANTIDADWFIHHDADEIREASVPTQTLARQSVPPIQKAIAPSISTSLFLYRHLLDERFESTDYVEQMHYYYLFYPRPNHRVNAWKKTER